MTSNILLIGAAIGSILFTMSAEAPEVCTKVINGKAVASAQCQAGRDVNDQLNSFRIGSETRYRESYAVLLTESSFTPLGTRFWFDKNPDCMTNFKGVSICIGGSLPQGINDQTWKRHPVRSVCGWVKKENLIANYGTKYHLCSLSIVLMIDLQERLLSCSQHRRLFCLLYVA